MADARSGASGLDLDTVDKLLTTTRAVRKRLYFSKDVPNELIRECVSAALQAPSGSNNLTMNFVVVKDEAKRKAIGQVYADCWALYEKSPMFAGLRQLLLIQQQLVLCRYWWWLPLQMTIWQAGQ